MSARCTRCSGLTNSKSGICAVCSAMIRAEAAEEADRMAKYKICPKCGTEQRGNAARSCYACQHGFTTGETKTTKAKEEGKKGAAGKCVPTNTGSNARNGRKTDSQAAIGPADVPSVPAQEDGVGVHDIVNHPKHYTSHPSGVECIQVVEHMGFNLGNAMKYLWRADLKGDAIEDLKKAQWYVTRELQRRGAA